jgi:hypothetical protein
MQDYVACSIKKNMWHDVVVIWQLVDDVAIDNWWMMWQLTIGG